LNYLGCITISYDVKLTNINGTYRLSQSFDSRLSITITIINRILVCIPSVILNKYEQCLFRALYLFACSALARIGELVVVRDGDTSKVIQLADVSFSSENKKIHEVNVCFKQFKHNTKGIPKTITFSHGIYIYIYKPSLTTTSSPIRARAEQVNKYNALKRHCSYLFKITLGIQTRMRLMIVIVIDRRESND
jgi:hypothetical protein